MARGKTRIHLRKVIACGPVTWIAICRVFERSRIRWGYCYDAVSYAYDQCGGWQAASFLNYLFTLAHRSLGG